MLWPSKGSDIDRYETGSSIQPSRPPSWEMDITSYFRSRCFDLDKIRYSLMQNNVQISGKWSKSKRKVDFQYGGHLFFKNESSNISAINWDMSTKFGFLIDFDLIDRDGWILLPVSNLLMSLPLEGQSLLANQILLRYLKLRLRYIFCGNPKWLGKGSKIFS